MPCESVNAVIAALEIVNGSLCNFLDPFTSDRSCNPNALVAFSLLLLQLLGSWRVTRLCGSVIPMSQRLRHLQVQVLEASCPNLCPENQSVSEAEEIELVAWLQSTFSQRKCVETCQSTNSEGIELTLCHETAKDHEWSSYFLSVRVCHFNTLGNIRRGK